MSFSTQVKEELNSIQIKGNCCKKAYLLGALISAELSEGKIILRLSDRSTAEKVTFLLRSLYKCSYVEKIIKKGCYEATELCFYQKKLEDFLQIVSSDKSTAELGGIFSCNNCRTAFLRGVFCSCGTVSDPKKSFSLELRLNDAGKISFVQGVIDTWGIDIPQRTSRGENTSLFYRKSSSIEDFLAACGSSNSVFLFYDITVEKDIRNTENRAANCVEKNIERSVLASRRQVMAIESLLSSRVIEDLPAELRYSAELRIKYPAMNLSELADMHEPPISKSGLNHRLSKLIEEAVKRKLI